MNAERRQVGWELWLGWVLASTMGAAIGSAVLDPVSRGMGFFVSSGAVHGAVAGFLMWGALGIAQWIVLRLTVPWARWWVVASILGGTLGFAVGEGVGARSFVFGALTGASVGTTQWLLVLRPVSRSGWYIVGSTVGIMLGWAVYLPVRNLLTEAVASTYLGSVEWWAAYGTLYLGFVMGWAAYGVLAGTVTGAALVWLLRQPAPESQAQPPPP